MKKIILLIALTCLTAKCFTQPPAMTISNDSITVNDLEKAVYSLPFKFKKIVIAQAVLETGWFKSKNFKLNNNLYGMRVPYNRMTTADTSINGYAHYKKWEESVIDYFLMASVRNDIEKITTEQGYYNYLDYIYSEVGPSYSSQLKDIIKRLKLDDLDNESKGIYHAKKLVKKRKVKPRKRKIKYRR